MANSDIVLFKNFDPEMVTIGAVRDNRNGPGKSSNLSHREHRFNIALTDMRFPFGASKKPDEYKKGDQDQWTLQCELTDEQIDRFKQLDEHILDQCLNKTDVLTALKIAKKSREVLESKYWNTLKYSKDKEGNVKGEYPPTIRINVPNNRDKGFNCDFFKSREDGSSELLSVDNVPGSDDNISEHLPPDCRGSVLVGVSLWISSSGFGLTLRANQIKVEPKRRLARGQCLLDNLVEPPNGDNVDNRQHEAQIEDPVCDETDSVEEALEGEELTEEEVEIEEEIEHREPSPKRTTARRVTRKTT